MADVALKKTVCGSCGAALREGAVFCVGCGEPVSKDEKPEIGTHTLVTSSNGQVADPSEAGSLNAPLIADDMLAQDKPKMRSAASMRSGTKAYNRKPVEVIWVQRETSGPFTVVSIVLVILTAILLALALYLK